MDDEGSRRRRPFLRCLAAADISLGPSDSDPTGLSVILAAVIGLWWWISGIPDRSDDAATRELVRRGKLPRGDEVSSDGEPVGGSG